MGRNRKLPAPRQRRLGDNERATERYHKNRGRTPRHNRLLFNGRAAETIYKSESDTMRCPPSHTTSSLHQPGQHHEIRRKIKAMEERDTRKPGRIKVAKRLTGRTRQSWEEAAGPRKGRLVDRPTVPQGGA